MPNGFDQWLNRLTAPASVDTPAGTVPVSSGQPNTGIVPSSQPAGGLVNQSPQLRELGNPTGVSLWNMRPQTPGALGNNPMAIAPHAPPHNPKFFNALAGIGNALMAPGNAMQGNYGVVLDPNAPGGVDPYSSMIPDAMNLAGLVTGGAGAVPAEAGALRMGAGLGSRGAKIPAQLETLGQVRKALQENGDLFARYSRGPKYDMAPGAHSVDYQTGAHHAGLSAVQISNDLTDEMLARYLRDYNYLVSKDNPASLHLYAGKSVGVDSDGADSIIPSKHVGKVSTGLQNFLNDEDNIKRLGLMQRIDRGRIYNDHWTKNKPNFVPTFVDLDSLEAQLQKLGGPIPDEIIKM